MRFRDTLAADLTLQQIRGKEGVRMRDTYQRLAKTYGVHWQGRSYERSNWEGADPINRALSAANAALYAIVLAGLHSLGYSPSLGFIHTGKQLSFVYDIADLVKTDTSIPAAFEAAAAGADKVESRARNSSRPVRPRTSAGSNHPPAPSPVPLRSGGSHGRHGRHGGRALGSIWCDSGREAPCW